MAGAEDEEDEGQSLFVWDDQSGLYYHASGFYHDPDAGWYYNTNDGIYYKFEDGQYIPWDSNQTDATHISTNQESENAPPSEWLEETLINLYLAGYSDEPSKNATEKADEDGESRESIFTEDNSSCEEKWLAQYGQVVKSDPETVLTFPFVDLWDWKIVNEKVKGGKLVIRVVGRPVKHLKKLHPSVSAGIRYLKSAPICKANLDMVQVETGKIYRLRNPSVEYLSSLSVYDSSNPTKDLGFPILDLKSLSLRTGQADSSKSTSSEDLSTSAEIHQHHYRDRASERRSLHGGFGVGIGQKHHGVDDADDGDMIYGSYHGDESVSGAFSGQSYGRRILESMGWKEGEAVGKTNKGLLEPLQVAGNKGTAGLGWCNQRTV